MSSTNRGSLRAVSDYYRTPAWAVHRILEALPASMRRGVWMDPCAGEGSIIQAAQGVLDGIQWKAIELRDECRDQLEAIPDCSVTIDNYLRQQPSGHVDVVLMNPPYRLAEEFIVHAMKHARFVVVLLRLNFLGAEKRSELLRAWAPDVYVLPNRPNFIPGQSGTDSIEYAWMVWDSSLPRAVGTVQVLPPSSKAERGVGTRSKKIAVVSHTGDADERTEVQVINDTSDNRVAEDPTPAG